MIQFKSNDGRMPPRFRSARFAAENATDIALALVDRLAMGVVVLDVSGDIIFCNQLAKACLSEEDGLRRVGWQLWSDRPAERMRLESIVEDAIAATQDGRVTRAALRIERDHGGSALAVVVSSVGQGPALGFEPYAAALVTISDVYHRRPTDASVLIDLYGLTPTQADVAVFFARGMTIDQIANSRNVGRDTVRAHMKQLFLKTGTKRQCELMQILQKDLTLFDLE